MTVRRVVALIALGLFFAIVPASASFLYLLSF
jgi:hypothetical protein